MKSSLLTSLLSLTSVSFCAPSLLHAKKQIGQVAETGESSTKALVQAFEQWHIHMKNINTFVDEAAAEMEKQMAKIRSERDYAPLAENARQINADINAEPTLLNTLANVLNLGVDAERAIVTLGSILGTNIEGSKLDTNLLRIEFNSQAPLADQLEGLTQEAREQQPDCLLDDQLKELNGIRCCNVLPAIETLFFSVATGSGISNLVDLSVPKPATCENGQVCTKQTRCGNPDYTTGYNYAVEPGTT
jgi:hypothetical protein